MAYIRSGAEPWRLHLVAGVSRRARTFSDSDPATKRSLPIQVETIPASASSFATRIPVFPRVAKPHMVVADPAYSSMAPDFRPVGWWPCGSGHILRESAVAKSTRRNGQYVETRSAEFCRNDIVHELFSRSTRTVYGYSIRPERPDPSITTINRSARILCLPITHYWWQTKYVQCSVIPY